MEMLLGIGEGRRRRQDLIAISADHYPYGLERSAIEELAGKKVDNNYRCIILAHSSSGPRAWSR